MARGKVVARLGELRQLRGDVRRATSGGGHAGGEHGLWHACSAQGVQACGRGARHMDIREGCVQPSAAPPQGQARLDGRPSATHPVWPRMCLQPLSPPVSTPFGHSHVSSTSTSPSSDCSFARRVCAVEDQVGALTSCTPGCVCWASPWPASN